MRPDLTKSQRRRIRELAGTVPIRNLSRELGNLEHDFALWRRGEIDAHDKLSDCIHRFHQGPNRRLFSIYTGSALEMAVAAAIARGTVTEDEATAEIVDLLLKFLLSSHASTSTLGRIPRSPQYSLSPPTGPGDELSQRCRFEAPPNQGIAG